jgi:hypothetical protein
MTNPSTNSSATPGRDPAPTRSRLVSPAGFLLVLLCFALPFVAVSCHSPAGTITARYSGADLVVGGEPDIVTDGRVPARTGTVDAPDLGVQSLAVITVVAVLAGIAVALLPAVRTRVLAGVAAGLVAFLGLVANQVVVVDALIKEVARSSTASVRQANDAVESGSGFTLALVLLLAVVGHNAAVVARRRR